MSDFGSNWDKYLFLLLNFIQIAGIVSEQIYIPDQKINFIDGEFFIIIVLERDDCF